MSDMSGWLFLLVSLLGFAHMLNALIPWRGRWTLVLTFFASWLTIELAFHHVAFGLLLTASFVAAGALDTVAGVVALVLMAVTLIGLLVLGIRSLRTRVQVGGALVDLDPEDGAPSFPLSHVLLPFLMGRRRGVSMRRNLVFSRVAGRNLRLDLTLPDGWSADDRRPALMQIHGGGWVIGDKREQGIPLLNHMASQGWVGVNVNYRLSPGATWPDHVVDCKRALAWVKEHADEWGIDPELVCVTGGSAGGHLTAHLALTANRPEYQPGFESADTSVAAAVPFYGVYDFTPEGEFAYEERIYSWFLEPLVFKAFLSDDPAPFRDASPIHQVHADAPPFFVIHGSRDTLTPVADARRFVERLEAVSSQPVVYGEMQGAQHAFEIFPSFRAARVIEGVERFLTTVMARRQAPTEAVEDELEEALTD